MFGTASTAEPKLSARAFSRAVEFYPSIVGGHNPHIFHGTSLDIQVAIAIDHRVSQQAIKPRHNGFVTAIRIRFFNAPDKYGLQKFFSIGWMSHTTLEI
jgi:hypothetical protein